MTLPSEKLISNPFQISVFSVIFQRLDQDQVLFKIHWAPNLETLVQHLVCARDWKHREDPALKGDFKEKGYGIASCVGITACLMCHMKTLDMMD